MTLHIHTGYMSGEKGFSRLFCIFVHWKFYLNVELFYFILFHLFVFDEDMKLNGNVFCKMVIVSLTPSFPSLFLCTK